MAPLGSVPLPLSANESTGKVIARSDPALATGGTLIGAFGNNTVKAGEDAGLNVDIKAPAPHTPSMVSALDYYFNCINKKK